MEEDASIIKKQKPTKLWEKKDNSSTEDCRLALIDVNEEDVWYMDSEC